MMSFASVLLSISLWLFRLLDGMTITVDIHPSSNTVCMLNEPDTSTAYSLSGHVSVSLSSSAATTFFDKSSRPEKILLRSLTLIFEGQAELLTNETGYSAVRLCRLVRELAPTQALLLSNEGSEGGTSDEGSVWNFVFDLQVPGWLPSSGVYGGGADEPAGTTYSLFVEARFTSLEEGLLSTLCGSFMSRERVVNAPRAAVQVVRYMCPAVLDDLERPSVFPYAVFSVETRNKPREQEVDSTSIPEEIYSSVELRASVPEYIDVDSGRFVLTVRLRADSLPLEQQQRLRLTHFRMALCQEEIYTRKPFRSYVSTYPLPSSQPDTKPLMVTSPMKALFDIGLSSVSFPDGLASRIHASFPLLAERQRRRHALPRGGIPLRQELLQTDEQVWIRVDVCVPFERVGMDQQATYVNGRIKKLRADEDSPLLRVRHGLEVELTFAYDGEQADDVPCVEHMAFNLPVKFARLPPAKQDCCSLALPAYSELFYSNGERRIDDTVPLPAYTPREESESLITNDKL